MVKVSYNTKYVNAKIWLTNEVHHVKFQWQTILGISPKE